MHRLSIVFTVLNIFLLSGLAAPLPVGLIFGRWQGFSGRGTWYYDDTNESACGSWDNNNEMIVAISQDIFGSGGYCGQSVQISANGQTASAVVGDKCQNCNPGDLDMSRALFEQFATLDVGVLSITWDAYWS